MEALKKAAGWIVAALITIGGVAAFWFYRGVLRDRAAAANARADATERILAPRIEEKQKRLRELETQAEVETIAIADARRELDAAKTELADKFQSHGLSADEIVARFRRIGLDDSDPT